MFSINQKKENGAGFSFSIDKILELETIKNKSIINKSKRVLITYNEKSKYKEALKQQIKFHGQGFIAMVELTPCKTEKEAKDLLINRGYEKLIWIE